MSRNSILQQVYFEKVGSRSPLCNNNNNNNNNLFIYSALFNMLGDQKRITTINNLKTINTNIRNIQIYLISKRY